ncbi:hypothetical protein K2173_026292 [Erythroxylum novogranatense]|uniref:Uncharacterized protein n=1 Tax=Erythroxylum novogranatense TaxID=1862640 RepID=A0AAV8SC78_9ROSI|nr:hypothetical protein K2173_026292 [Erythroxylum novogranatense]
MARSFSNAKLLSGMITRAINGRGFAVSAAPNTAMLKKTGEETTKVSWVPDPRTGCYRPENVAEEIDAAELRAMLLKKH